MNSNSSRNNTSVFSKYRKVFYYIFLVVFVLVIIYLIFYAYQKIQELNKNEPILVSSITDANKANVPNGINVPTPTEGLAQTMSTWIYVKDYNTNFGKYKNILWKGDKSTSTPRHSPSLWLYPMTNNLKVLTSVDSEEGIESCDIQNIPLMKWNHIVYVLNNRSVDVYVNGKLERSCALKAIPKLEKDKVFITAGSPPGYGGKIGKTQYFTRALTANEIADLYISGPVGSTNYNVQFFKDGNFITVKPKGL